MAEIINVTVTDSQELITVSVVDEQQLIAAGLSVRGDMQKKVYDTDNTGIVDMSEDTQLFGGFALAYLQSYLLGRANHTGTQLAATISDFTAASQLALAFGIIITESGTTRTLLASDSGKTIRYTNAAGCTVTIPDTLLEGHTCLHVQKGAVVVNFVASGSMVIKQADAHTGTAKLEAVACTIVEATNECNLNGYTA